VALRVLSITQIALLALVLVVLPTAGTAAETGQQRLVSLAPSLTETVAALGCEAQLVGVSDYVVWPPQALALPRLGGLHNPNVERILALAPDLVLLPSAITKVEKACAAAGIRIEHVLMEDLPDVRRGILRVAELLDCPERGQALVAELDQELAAVAAQAGEQPRLRVLLVLDRPPTGRLQSLTVAGPGTFLDQLAALAGGDNVFEDASRLYFTPSLEAVLSRRPDVIIELRPAGTGINDAETRARAEWQALFGDQQAPLVQVVAGDEILIPGPRMGVTAARLAAAMRGEG
jgi:iron complex transport system substrate-binding protein